MKKHILDLTSLTALFLCLSCLNVIAQINNPNRTPGKFPTVVPDNQDEVTGIVDKSKEKSNDPNYDSKGKGGFMGDFVRWWNENSPAKPQPVPLLNNPTPSGHGPFFQGYADDYSTSDISSSANNNHYFSYGIGIGIAAAGGKFKYPSGSATENILYAQIPVMVRYSYILSNGSTLFANAGPYYGIAISGSYKDDMGKTKFKFGNGTNDDYRRGDYGLRFGIGYKIKSQPVFIGLAAGLGLRNITPGGDKQVKIKNQSVGLQVGYVF